ncbi:1-hydroxycarotenoid 3,4-desaturase CrtD [Thalassococcus sp. S3]|uniref:1-hydroxycarotenoid 3,4-desaturase CrtD n=1 Tax=Thalassococcus sp. S3 TaxID=2017482 RepID=UPI0010244C8F|nr:1-hydroxycarotenoid 3,4-desaturase CrtD [Thalassococcus sp. S3]QBF34158.1 methoxyneurosporene dehydrogenase [Thalassococcus sp. S3]
MTFAKPTIVPDRTTRPRVVVIGAGMGGLAGAIRLAAAGLDVTVIERHAHVGGKIRTLPSAAGPVDAGPTVLTMRHVFDDLFASAGARLDDHVTLVPQEILARHVWSDGSTLDLFADMEASAAAIRAFAAHRSEAEFRGFCERCRQLFAGFDAPMMQSAEPRLSALTRHVLARPYLIAPMAPLSTLGQMLRRQFSDPRLAQLFGRYATYVGGSPFRSPAVLALIWQAEAAGVWVVKGGIHKLAGAMAELAAAHGVRFEMSVHVDRLSLQGGRVRGVSLEGGRFVPAEAVLFNGDPRALATGALGPGASAVARQTLTLPRSFSARVHSFAATPSGRPLAHHNVYFGSDPASEFDDLVAGRLPRDPTLYLCAEDRGQGHAPPALERFEIIANAPPMARAEADADDTEVLEWHAMIMQKMAQHGTHFSPTPGVESLTTPQMFNRLFPESLGSLYGQSPHGLTAAFQRPTARTTVPGLYLAGGGTHPGAGVPMATRSASHAAAAILSDLTSTSMSAPMAMPGGMSTG